MRKKVTALCMTGVLFMAQMGGPADAKSVGTAQVLEAEAFAKKQTISEQIREEGEFSDRFLVKYAKKESEEEIRKAAEAVLDLDHLHREKERERDSLSVEVSEIEKSVGGYQVLTLTEKVDAVSFQENFLAEISDEIESIQPDYLLELSSEMAVGEWEDGDTTQEEISSDTAERYPEMDARSGQTGHAFLEREEDLQYAWTFSKGAGVTIALLDTGVDLTHPDLAGHLREGYDFRNHCTLTYDVSQEMTAAHGTHIAGILANTAPEAEILPLKVFENGKAYTSEIIEAIAYAKEQGASIVNMSFGSTNYNQALYEAMSGTDMFFVCAAGNHRRNLQEAPVYPASFGLENSISVAAVNQDLGLSYFSNYGAEGVDLAAWGRDVMSAVPGGGCGKRNGTSMAAAYVSGAAALAASVRDGAALKEELKKSAWKMSCLEGRVCDGNMLSFSSLALEIENHEIIERIPAEDFDVLEVRMPSENWELFAGEENAEISVGNKHCLVLKTDGTVWGWGDNSYGQVGDGSTETVYEPRQVVGLTNIRAIAAGYQYSLALDWTGNVWAWGRNDYGQLGDDTTVDRPVPVKLVYLSSRDTIQSISAGYAHSVALGKSGNVWGWGYGEGWNLGEATGGDSVPFPILISGFNTNVTGVFAGWDITLALGDDGKVWGVGSSMPGYVEHGGIVYVPEEIYGLSDIGSFASGHGTIYGGIDQIEGFTHAWGQGCFGGGASWESVNLPTYIHGSTLDDMMETKEASFGMNHGAAVRADGRVWTWGSNAHGELGDGTTTDRYMMTEIEGISDIVSIRAGNGFTLALKEDGSIWGWGTNASGELGLGESVAMQTTPRNIMSNTRPENALELTFQESISDYIMEEGEHRYYRFTSEQTADYRFDLSSRRGGIRGILTDVSGNVISDTDDEESGEIRALLEKGTTYKLEVFGSGNNDMYTLCVDYWDDCGNSIANASRISSGKRPYRINYPKDEDMFCFVPVEDGNYAFQSISGFDTYGYLYDANGKQLVYNDDGQGKGESKNNRDFYFTSLMEAGKTYYIKVKAFSTSVIGDYQLKIDYADDYKNTPEEAFVISGQGEISGRIDYRQDVDVFQWTPQETGTYLIYTKGSANVKGTVCKQDGTEIIANDDISAVDKNFLLKADLSKGTKYYIKVEAGATGWLGNSYSLRIEKRKSVPEVILGKETILQMSQTQTGFTDAKVIDQNGNVLAVSKAPVFSVNADGKKEARIYCPLAQGEYRVLLYAGESVAEATDISVAQKKELTPYPCEADEELLIPFLYEGQKKVTDYTFSVGYASGKFDLIDVNDDSEVLENASGTAGNVSAIVTEGGLSFKARYHYSYTSQVNTVKLKVKSNTKETISCYAYQFF